ncbi:MAG: adenylosuccinate lyase [Candidatus Diapherotrites archaeon]|nr:adenylosuccinate lyase [Candidatus Diapherotrites archaeon]
MYALFDEESKLQKMLQVEVALARAHARIGAIPKKDARAIAAAAKRVKLERVKKIEKRTHHDVMAVADALAEKAGAAGKWVHMGATSYDIVDTMWALILKDAAVLLAKDLKALKKELRRLAKKHRKTVMVGRTHGQHALPITFGLKCAVWLSEVQAHEERLQQLQKRVLVGKMSGAVGTFAGFGTTRVQKLVMKELGLGEPGATNQVVQREGMAEMVAFTGIVAGTVEKIAKEVRNLSRSEIKEVEEAFAKGQVGSSTMPQKRNPHKSENLCGVARVIRSNVMVAMENIALEHERDLTNSSAERIILPESFVLTDYSLRQMASILHGLNVYPKRMRENLEADEYVMSESIMLALVKKGVPRQKAHAMVKKAAMASFTRGRDYRATVAKAASAWLSGKELDKAMDPHSYLGESTRVVDKVLRECR